MVVSKLPLSASKKSSAKVPRSIAIGIQRSSMAKAGGLSLRVFCSNTRITLKTILRCVGVLRLRMTWSIKRTCGAKQNQSENRMKKKSGSKQKNPNNNGNGKKLNANINRPGNELASGSNGNVSNKKNNNRGPQLVLLQPA